MDEGIEVTKVSRQVEGSCNASSGADHGPYRKVIQIRLNTPGSSQSIRLCLTHAKELREELGWQLRYG